MLNQLLNSVQHLTPSLYSSRSPRHLESVTEEETTKNLLYPDPGLLQQCYNHASPLDHSFPVSHLPSGFDDRGGLELDPLKDFRVIIAQDKGRSTQPLVLLDAKPLSWGSPSLSLHGGSTAASRATGPPAGRSVGPPSSPGLAQGARHVRGGSHFNNRSQPPSPGPAPPSPYGPANSKPVGGSLKHSRSRGMSLSAIDKSSDNVRGGSEVEEDAETRAILECMFGNAQLWHSYRGPSTKFHHWSPDPPSHNDSRGASPELSSREFQPRRPTPLERSRTSTAVPSVSRYPGGAVAVESKDLSKGIILATKTFSLNIPRSETSKGGTDAKATGRANSPTQRGSSPSHLRDPDGRNKSQVPTDIRTPMFAVAVVVRLAGENKTLSRPPSRFGNPNLPNVPPTRQSVSSSLDSIESFSAHMHNLSTSNTSWDERLQGVSDHWDVISRTLATLQVDASRAIFRALNDRNLACSEWVQKADLSSQVISYLNLWLPAYALASQQLALQQKLKEAAALASQRIALALRIPKVIAGQGRWGVWRDEARWVHRWAGGKENNFFFLNLLTAFLGNHTEWLSLLGPSAYKRRHRKLQRAQTESDAVLSNRTVIVGLDKMGARRLIFLLSAFLPGENAVSSYGSPGRNLTSQSLRTYSQSPPMGGQVGRQMSLRRTINRRTKQNQVHDADPKEQTHHRKPSVSSSVAESVESGERPPSQDEPIHPQSRRGSDVRSVRNSGLPIPFNPASTRKSSATTTSTVTPSKTNPVAHIVKAQGAESAMHDNRPGSSDSLASADLRNVLRRSESVNISNASGDSRRSWISGFWSNRRESSSDTSYVPGSQDLAGSQIYDRRPPNSFTRSRSGNKLAMMADEVSNTHDFAKSHGRTSSATIEIPPYLSRVDSSADYSRTPEDFSLSASQRSVGSPLKLDVDTEGVVDVEIPLPNFLSTSGDSTMASPIKGRYDSSTSLEGLGQSHASLGLFTHQDLEHPANVAGWLRRFHEDFALQALRPYPEMLTDIKRGMKAESTPPSAFPATKQGTHGPYWADICTTLIADVRSCTIKRVRLQRKLSPDQQDLNYRPRCLDEQFLEEPVMDIDGTLADAIERLISRSGFSTRMHSRAPSPSGYHARGRQEVRAERDDEESPSSEIPKQECKKTVLMALEQVVRSVRKEFEKETSGKLKEDVEDRGEERGRTKGRNNNSLDSDNTLREGIRHWLEGVQAAA